MAVFYSKYNCDNNKYPEFSLDKAHFVRFLHAYYLKDKDVRVFEFYIPAQVHYVVSGDFVTRVFAPSRICRVSFDSDVPVPMDGESVMALYFYNHDKDTYYFPCFDYND